MLRFWPLVFCLIFISCSSQYEDETDGVVETANIYLISGNCQAAIDLLEAYGRQERHAAYLQTLASAYACRAGFGEPTFIETDISNLSTTDTGFLGSTTTFTTSEMTSAYDNNFVDLFEAIEILKHAGGVTIPSVANRGEWFNAGDALNIDLQLLYMTTAALGKYLFYYGNADPVNGEKADGAAANGNNNGNTNTCLRTYTDATAIASISAGVTGPCQDTANTGHPDLDVATVSLAVTRMCQGLTLMNVWLDTILNISVISQAGSLDTAGTNVSTLFDTVCSSALGNTICEMKSFSLCQSTYAGDTDSLEQYFAAVFETMFL